MNKKDFLLNIFATKVLKSIIVILFLAMISMSLNAEEKSAMKNNYKKPSMEEIKQKLSPEEFAVTQESSTEAPFKNKYWDNKKEGIYVDIVSGEPLFSSKDKYDSGTGWPSFSKPLDKNNITTQVDKSLFLGARTEVRSKSGDSHLGHVFNDGPGPDGNRFCMNSASLRFVPLEKLTEEGYGEYVSQFENENSKVGDMSKNVSTEQRVILAGGCFWGMQEIIRKIPGVISTKAGYSGGTVSNPTYEISSSGTSGHAESVEVVFNPKLISFAELLGYYFRMHDPTTINQQGNDKGTQYRSAIFYTTEEQKEIAEKVKTQVSNSGKWDAPVVTEITAAKEFYPAEDYHQDYLQKHPDGYTCHFLR